MLPLRLKALVGITWHGLYLLMCRACTACVSHLCDPWVCALAVDAVVLQPLVLRVGAVLL